ncbi:hypothetical protein [Helcococcus massiliensis]|uniref:hypothetical protein n=1 Tax=Helcococcus massiliensis TaxID=2040290 RepID=UPI0013565260|nr:hypothetical protein [Helcococcus massiliensis]
MKNKIVTKGQLKFMIFTNLFIFATIGLIIYELKKIGGIKYSYIMLGLIFALMAVNQVIYYKNNKAKSYAFMAGFFGLISLLIIIFSILRLL